MSDAYEDKITQLEAAIAVLERSIGAYKGQIAALKHLQLAHSVLDRASGGPVAPSTGISMGTGVSVAPPGPYMTYNPVGNVQKHPDIRVDPPYDR